MKKHYKLLIYLMIFLLILGGCGAPGRNRSDNNDANPVPTEDKGASKDTFTFKAEVMDSEQGLLVTPDPDSNEYRSSDKISVNTSDSTIKDVTGKKITFRELKPGDLIQITYDGIIMESYPAQIKVSDIVVVDHNYLIDGYLAIIDDIYKEDPALNSDMDLLALDTTGWTKISKPEKEIIIEELKKRYAVEIKEGTYEELVKEGLIDKKELYFPKGVLITLSVKDFNEKKKVITFTIEKWKSGLGAIGWKDSKAKNNGTKWEITRNNQWIS